MSIFKSGGKGSKSTAKLGRKSRSSFVTKSGQTIKINRSLGNRIKAYREDRSKQKALRLAGMPKSRVKRFFYRLHPKRMYKYWFSREGAIMALKIVGIGTLASFFLIIGVFAYFRKDLPNIKDVSGKNIGGSILYYDRTGQTLLWEDVDGVKRIPVSDENISPFIKQATIAIEDKDFFKHGGFDVKGILRAGVNNAFGKSGKQGGSTITQQLVRLTQPDVGKERTYKRKIKELILSVELEREYSKKDILTGYLNSAPYGGIEWGVEAAAQDYFHKSAKDLDLAESAMLAAIPQTPNYYSPYNKTDFDQEGLIGRQHYILDLMEQQGMITSEQRDEAKKVDVLAKVQPRKPRYEGIQAPWFVLTAKQELERRMGTTLVKRGGWKVITTLDLNAQKLAEEQVQKGLTQVRRQGGDTVAFVAEDVKNGHVVALVGGTDFNNPEFGQNNYAHDLELPPGSSFKPYDYAALIENSNNAGAGSVLYDTQGPVPGYACTKGPRVDCLHDYDFRYPGPVTLRYGLGASRNVPAIKAMLIVGIDKTIETSHRLMTNFGTDGQPDPSIGNYRCYSDEQSTQVAPCYASSAIGDGAYLRLDEHVHGYATLSRNGLNIPQTYILKVTDADNKVIDEWKPSKGTQAIRPDAAYIVSDMLSDPNASYFPAGNKPQRYKNWKFSSKTGTTNDSKDGLMMMFSTQYAAGVWVGYHNRQKVMSGFMEQMTQPIVQGWMRPMHDNLPVQDREKPSGVKTLPAFIVRSHVGNGTVEPSTATDLFPSWYEPKKTTGKRQTIDVISNKLATNCTPARAKKEVTDVDANSFSVDTFVGQNTGANTSATDDIHKCEDVKPNISLSQAGNSVIATVTQGTHPLSSDRYPGTVNFIIDGQVVNSAQIGGSGSVSYTPDLNFSGTKEIKAEIIDSVLYDATSNSVTLTGSGGGTNSNPLTITAPASGEDIGNGTVSYTVQWTGGTAPFTLLLDGTPVCQNTNAVSCPITVGGTNGVTHTLLLTQTGGTPATITFKK